MTMSPINAELLRNAMSSIADEMYIALMKSAYSTNIKERKDHSTAIFDSNGRVVVQGESMPLHLASMLGLIEIVLEKYGKNRRRRPGNLRAERELRAHLRARLRVRSTSYHRPRRDIRMNIELSRASVGTQTDTSDPSG